MRENLYTYLNHVVPECQITNKVNNERDKCNNRSQGKKYKQIDVYGSLLEGKRHHSLAKQDKITFLNEPKQTELACENDAHQQMCDL